MCMARRRDFAGWLGVKRRGFRDRLGSAGNLRFATGQWHMGKCFLEHRANGAIDPNQLD